MRAQCPLLPPKRGCGIGNLSAKDFLVGASAHALDEESASCICDPPAGAQHPLLRRNVNSGLAKHSVQQVHFVLSSIPRPCATKKKGVNPRRVLHFDQHGRNNQNHYINYRPCISPRVVQALSSPQEQIQV